MARIDIDNFKPIEPCPKCPAFDSMVNIAVTRTLNSGMPVEEWVVVADYPDRVFYAYDPENTQAGAVVLGPDTGCVDAFCQGHEAASSRVLGEAHQACLDCTGPKEMKVGILKRRSRTVCGAGFEKDTGLVNRLNRIGARQGRSALSSIDTILAPSPRA